MSERRQSTYLWYVPNQARAGFRGDEPHEDHNSLETLTRHVRAIEDNGWEGSLIGTGWHRPDTFTLGATLAARTATYEPLIAARPGYWHPANFAASAATLDHLSQGRVRINIVSGPESVNAYGDAVTDRAARYTRTREFLEIVRRLWTESEVTYHGEHFTVEDATLGAQPVRREGRPHPPLYFGGASPEAERVAAELADVQLFWAESYASIEERISRLQSLSAAVGRAFPPLQYGLRTTVVARETAEEAWEVAEGRIAEISAEGGISQWNQNPRHTAVGQQRVVELSRQGALIDDVLYTAPAALGSQGAGSTWLVGSFEEVAHALGRYRELGIDHFILSDTPYLREVERLGRHLLPLIRAQEESVVPSSATAGAAS